MGRLGVLAGSGMILTCSQPVGAEVAVGNCRAVREADCVVLFSYAERFSTGGNI
jgi:hypothetical protein